LVALVGISIFRAVFPGAPSRGPGLKEETLGPARVFVLPNPSGLNQAYPGFESKLVWFLALARECPVGL